MRIVFAGTPEFAAHSLAALLEAGHQVIAVYTQPDRPAGRGRKAAASPVKQLALTHQLEVRQPQTLRDPEAQQALRDLEPDLMVVAAYGLILPQAVLDMPRLGCINVHASLLPRWRGAAPIQRAIAAGDTETGITIMQMDAGLDTGAMLLKRSTPITPDETGQSLHDRLALLGGLALLDALPGLLDGTLQGEPQDEHQACYAAKLSKEEAHIDWQQPASVIERLVRAFNPWPVTYTQDGEQRVRVLQARVADSNAADNDVPSDNVTDTVPGTVLRRARDGIEIQCGQGRLVIEQLQLPGARAMSVSDLINGGRPALALGSRLG